MTEQGLGDIKLLKAAKNRKLWSVMIAYALKGYGTGKISYMKWNSLFKEIHPFSFSVIQIEKKTITDNIVK